MTLVLNEDFEGPGYENSWIETLTSPDTINDASQAITPANGSYCCELTGNASGSLYIAHVLDTEVPNTTVCYLQFKLYTTAWISTTKILYWSGAAGVLQCRLIMSSTGAIQCQYYTNGGLVTIYTTSVFSTDTWYDIEVMYDPVGMEFKVWVDDILDIDEELTGDIAGGCVNVRLGSVFSSTFIGSMYFDSVKMDDSDRIGGSTELPINFTGDVTGSAVATGEFSKKATVSGDVSAAPGSAGVISVLKNLPGDISATTAVGGSVSVKKYLSGTVTSSSDLSGQISVLKVLSGAISATADIQGELLLQGTIRLSGGVGALSGIAGEVSVKKQLSGLVSAISDAAGQITITQVGEKLYLTGAVSAQSGAETAGIYVKKNLSGSIEHVADASGSISAKLNLSGDVGSVANVIGEISRLVEGGLGIIIDPTIESVTATRLIESISKKYTIHSI